MIERHVSFTVSPDRSAEFERFFVEQYRPPALKMPGLVECALLRQTDRPESYQMVYRWETAEQAAAWRANKGHQALQPTLNELTSDMHITAYSRVA
jgi:heme-degrading monooxygenase HmoA